MIPSIQLKRVLIAFVLVSTFTNAGAQVNPLVGDCPVNSISPTSLSAGNGAGQVYPTITVSTLNNCTNYTITNNYSWISYSKNGLYVTISVQSNTGSARTGTVSIGGLTLTVVQACGNYPGAAGSITGTSPVCQNQTGVHYSVASITGATGYSWTFPTGATIDSGNNTRSIRVYFSSSAVSGNITVRGTNSCGNGGVSPNFAVTVNTASSQPGAISGATTVCSGSTYTYSISPVTGASSYSWTIPSGASGSSTTNSINITFGSNPGTVSVKANSSLGCSSPARNLSVSLSSLIIYNVTGGSNTICPGSSVAIGLDGSTSGIVYKCYLNGGLQIPPVTGNGSAIPFGNKSYAGTYTVTGISNEGCEIPMNGSATINFKTPSTPASSINAQPDTTCPGQSTTLIKVGGSLETGYGVWEWYSGTCGSTSEGTGTSITVHPTMTTTYYVRAEGGCTTTSCVSATVTVRPTPTITTQPVNTTVSPGQNALFSIVATGINLSYLWQTALSVDGPWTDLTSSSAIGYQTANVTILGSSSFTDSYYRCMIYEYCFDAIYSNPVKIILSFPSSNYLPGTNIPDPETRTLNTGYLVGSTKGNFNVDAIGGASYSIPIDVPPGVNGLSPNISLIYSSNNSSGIPGYGWQINGFSLISLGPETYYNDSYVGKDDRFYLDGQSLLNMIASDYSSANAVYQTEYNNFTRVTPEAVVANKGPKWFKAETKSGLIYEYGNSQDSKQQINDNSPVMNWYVSKISDLFGNQINFSYIQDHYSVYPSAITYGPNTITFYYKQRSDKSFSLLDSFRIEQWLLLDKIVITYNSTIVKTYEFNQSLQVTNYNSYSALNEVVEYGTNSSRLNSTVFSYQNPANVSFSQTTYNTTHDFITYKSKLLTGDFNGDGKSDFFCLPDSAKGATWKGIRVYSSDGADNFNLLINSTIYIDPQRVRDIRAIDLNGDGKDDIVYEYSIPSSDSSKFYYMLCDGQSLTQPVLFCTRMTDSHTGMSGKIRRIGLSQEDNNERFNKHTKQPFLSKNNLKPYDSPKTGLKLDFDMDGDGLNEIFINDPTGHVQVFKYSGSSLTSVFDVQFLYGDFGSDVLEGDFDGNGRTDLWSFTSTGLKIVNINTQAQTVSTSYNSSWPTNSYNFIMGDFNGDGKTDLFLYGYNGSDWPTWQIQLSTGTGFEEHDVPQKKANLLNDNVMVGDFNGDGLTDLMVTSKNQSWTGTYFYVSSNNGTDFYWDLLNSFPTTNNNFYLADFNGDGITDFICTDVVSQGWNGYKVFKSTGNTALLMDRMANGLGFVTKVAYTKLSQASSSIYQKESNALFPVIDFQGPWPVVNTVWFDNGKGSKNSQNYYYQGAKVHRQGKGFLTFSKTSVTDNASGIQTENTAGYDLTYYYPKIIKSLSRRAGTSDTLEVVNNTWAQILGGQTNPYSIFPYVQNSVEVNKLTGLSSTSTYQYDYYGNPGIVTKNCLNGPTVTSITNYENDATSSQWLLGRPVSGNIQYSKNGSPTITISWSKVYASGNNNLTDETWYSGTNSQISKHYDYYANGSLQVETAMASSMTRSKSYIYESDNIRMHSSTDQLSHTTTNSYDNNGRLYTQQDYLGNTATYLYDNFGRQTSVTLSDGSQTSVIYAWEDTTANPIPARYSVLKTGNDGSQTKTWYDKLGRVIRSDVKGFDGTMIYTSTVYNIKGQVESVSDPYYSSDSPQLNTFTYDNYGRKTGLSRPTGRNSSWSYSTNTVTETTAGKTYTKTYSADGTVSSATDPGGTISYLYYLDGKVKSIEAPGTNTTTSMIYDIAGNQISLTDPSAGTITYNYDGFGELTSQVNPGSVTTSISYFPDGRINTKTSPEGTTTYNYNSNLQVSGITSPQGISRSFVYDSNGRISSLTETIPGSNSFTTSVSYDGIGRKSSMTHPSGITETYGYNINGYLNTISTGGAVRWTTNSMNARGQVTSGTYFNNLSTSFGFDTYGFPTSIVTGAIQNYSYNFNPVTGNLNWRQNNNYSGLTESFTYDNLDRLSSVTQGSNTTLTMTYDGNTGGITGKSDAGTFVYGTQTYPYRITNIQPTTGLVPSNGQIINYTSFQKVSSITENNYEADFLYNSDNSRDQLVVKQNLSTILTRWYPTDSYLKETSGSVTKEYTFIGGDAYTAKAVAIKQNGVEAYYSLLRDHLGSITHVVDSTGTVIAEYSYDAWGRMRNPSTWANYAPGLDPQLMVAGRGFTGHEHMPWFNSINMNGRVYDPLIGMFLSPDNYVQEGDNSQNFNRYSYCINNPLKYSDPSGMLMAPPGVGDAVDQYYGAMCDVNNPTWGGGGGGGGWGFVIGADEDYIAKYLYNSNVLFYGYSINQTTHQAYNNYTGQYVGPNSSGSLSRENIKSILDGIKDGFSLYVYDLFGRDNVVLSKGDPDLYFSTDGGYMAENSTAGIFALDPTGQWLNPSGGESNLSNLTAAEYFGWFSNVLGDAARYSLEGMSKADVARSFIQGIGISAKTIGYAGMAIYVYSDFVRYNNSPTWGNAGRLGVDAFSIVINFAFPGPGTAIGFGAAFLNATGVLDGFYNFLDNNQSLYNSTGHIIVPGLTPLNPFTIIKIK
jgi:RHS repeat-associated protein